MSIKQSRVLDWEDALAKIKSNVSVYLDSQIRNKGKLTSPLQDLMLKGFSEIREFSTAENDLISRCYKLDPKARDIVKKLILKRLTEINDLSTFVVDSILQDYYIDYYGSPSSLTSSNKTIGITMINKILIPRDSDYDTKLEKLAQVVYQELYGLSIIDEFMYMSPIDRLKIEEVATFGPTAFWFMVSGNSVKLDKITIPPRKLKQIAERLAKCAYRFSLNPKNNRISTDSLNNDRVSLTADTYSKYYEFNVRRAYPYTLTIPKLIEWRSTSVGFETFQDDLMLVAPRIAVIAEQAAGKSSMLRRLAERYPEGTRVGTIESSYELNLSSIPHLIVKELKVVGIDPESALDDSLRFALQIMINGEARTGKEWAATLQAAKRSKGGTMATGHSSDVLEFISSAAQLLIRDNVYTNEESAINAVIECLDIFILPACDNVGNDATGHRYTGSVWEIPKKHVQYLHQIEPRLLFEAEDIYNLKQVNPISQAYKEVLIKRLNGKYLDVIERMASYNYDTKSNW